MSLRILKISSKAIRAANYNKENQLLKIQFKTSSQWYSSYLVPENIIDDFETADSQGAFWHENIKNNYE